MIGNGEMKSRALLIRHVSDIKKNFYSFFFFCFRNEQRRDLRGIQIDYNRSSKRLFVSTVVRLAKILL